MLLSPTDGDHALLSQPITPLVRVGPHRAGLPGCTADVVGIDGRRPRRADDGVDHLRRGLVTGRIAPTFSEPTRLVPT